MGEALFLNSNANVSQLLQTLPGSVGDIFRSKVWSQTLLRVIHSHLGNLLLASRADGTLYPAGRTLLSKVVILSPDSMKSSC